MQELKKISLSPSGFSKLYNMRREIVGFLGPAYRTRNLHPPFTLDLFGRQLGGANGLPSVLEESIALMRATSAHRIPQTEVLDVARVLLDVAEGA